MAQLRDEDYLTGDMISKEHNRIMILDEPIYKKKFTNKGQDEQLECHVNFNGEKLLWTPNKGCRKVFKEAYGKDTKNWIGKIAECSTYEKKVQGEDKDIIQIDKLIDPKTATKEDVKIPEIKEEEIKEEKKLICSLCQEPITENVYNYSMKFCKTPACVPCQKEFKKPEIKV